MYHISECLHDCEQDLFNRLHQNYLEAIDDLEDNPLGHFSLPDFDFGNEEEEEKILKTI